MTARHLFLGQLRDGLLARQVNGTSVLVGVSGGADSVALLLGVADLRGELDLRIRVAHLNHQLRGADSDADAAWVRQLCEDRGIPVTVGTADLDPQGPGIEEAARKARHRFLDQAADDGGCDVIITAHTADDQSETVLHHVLRGTGMAGLRGIPDSRMTELGFRLVRPMLGIRRDCVEQFLAEIGQDYRSDATNADTSLTRNWLRHKLFPDLRERFGPRVDVALIRLAEQAAEIEQTLTLLAERLLAEVTLDVQPDAVRISTRALAAQPLHLVRELFRLVWQRQGWPRQLMGFEEWNRVAQVALAGGDINLPGQIRARQNPPGLLVLEKTNRQTVVRL